MGKSAKRAKVEDAEKVSCRHLLVKHAESRRPKSWKSEAITRSKAEALAMIGEFRSEVAAEEGEALRKRFEEIASKESDCNSYKRGGDLGAFGRGRMQKPFEEAAFALELGELSEPVETASGVHLILRYA